MVPLDPYRISPSGAGAPTQLISFLTKALLSARAHSYICVLACELKAQIIRLVWPLPPQQIMTLLKTQCEDFFFFWCITYGRSVNTSSWTSCLQMVIQMKPRACGALLTDNEGTHGKTTDEIRSCHILSIPAALRGLGLACVVSVLPCLRAAAAVCAPSSPLMFYTGCTAEPQISCLVPSRRSSGQLH